MALTLHCLRLNPASRPRLQGCVPTARYGFAGFGLPPNCTTNAELAHPLEAIIADLERIGYKNLGDGGRAGRYFLSRGDKPNETFYVHLCYEDNQMAKDQLTFKWIEGTNLTVRRKYKRLKIMLADAFPDDRDMYRELKGLFIEGVLSAYRQAAGEDFEEG